MAIMALMVVPALMLEEVSDPWISTVAHVVNWMVWLGFCFEFALLWVLAGGGWRYVRQRWFDLLLIVLSPPFLVPEALQSARGLRSLRLVRFFRIMRIAKAGAVATIGFKIARRLLGRRQFHYTAAVSAGIIVLGALIVSIFEGKENPKLQTLGGALWWAVTTATTVGYGDVSPQTTEGKVAAVIVMAVGIGITSVFTATVANYFFFQESADSRQATAKDVHQLRAVVDTLGLKIDALRSASWVKTRATGDQ